MPRPKLGRERINITLPPETIRKLDAVAKTMKVTRSDLIQTAVDRLLPRVEKKK